MFATGRSPRRRGGAHAQPVRAPAGTAVVRVGRDLDRDDMRTFRVSRIRGDIRFATRRERDFRVPRRLRLEDYRGRRPGSSATSSARRGSRSRATPPGGWSAPTAASEPARGRLFVTEYASPSLLARWSCARTAAPCRSSRPSSSRASPTALVPRARAPRGRAAEPRADVRRGASRARRAPAGPSRRSASACSRRCSPTCSPPAARTRGDRSPRRARRALQASPTRQLEEHLSLLNLVNFGGGCYAVYAELRGDEVHVDKELFGDTFRRPPRLTPLEARAIRLALEFVGPMVAADAHTPLDRVRAKLEETFGAFDLRRPPTPHGRRARRTSSRRSRSVESTGSSRSST